MIYIIYNTYCWINSDCGLPPRVTNGKIVLDAADTHFRSSAQFHCFNGYKPTVSWDGITVTFYKISLVCSADRYWVTSNTGTSINAEDIKCQGIAINCTYIYIHV